MLLVQASCCILVHLIRHKLNDVGDTFAGDWALGRPVTAEFMIDITKKLSLNLLLTSPS